VFVLLEGDGDDAPEGEEVLSEEEAIARFKAEFGAEEMADSELPGAEAAS
jgi:hypothetical protein